MTAQQLYKILTDAGVEFDVVEIFDGARFIRVEVEEDQGYSK